MNNDTIVIDIKANFTDNTSSGAKKAQKAIDNLEKSAKSVSNKKHSVRFSADDKATPTIKKISSAAKQFAGKTFRSVVSFNDKASSVIHKAESSARQFASKTYRSTLSVVDKFTAPLSSLRNMLFSINSLITTVAAGLATKLVVAEPVSYADSMTTASIAFETMLGSAEASAKMMSDIMDFAKKTPFDTSGLISSTQQMMAFGFEADETLGYMEKIGNVMSAMGKGEEGIDSVTRALGQMRATGRVNAQDMMQLTSVGIKAWDYLAKGMGKSVAEVRKMSEDGEIAAETAITHIMKGLEEFDGMMDKMSNRTVSGLWSNIKDTFQQSVVLDWGEGLQKGAIQGLVDMRDWLDRIDPLLQSAGTSLSEIGEGASAAAFDLLNSALKRLSDTLGSEEFKNADSLGEKIKIVWDEVIWEPFSEWWDGTGKQKLASKLSDFGEGIGRGLSNGLLALFGVDVTETLDGGVSLGVSLAEGFKKGFDGEAVGEAMLDAIKGVFASGGAGLADMLLPGDQGASRGSKILGTGLAIGGTYLAAKGITAADSLYKTLAPIGGKLSTVGTALTGGAATGAQAALIGGGSIAGGIIGGATLIDAGFDFYAAHKAGRAGDRTEYDASSASGAVKLGGVAAGAAIGTMIAPGVGTLIGAGIGGIAGWIGGEKAAEKIREDAAQLERETMAARYESEEMKKAIMDADSSAESLADTFNDVVSSNIAERFGDIKLTTSEIATLAKNIVFGDNLKQFENFASATQAAETSLLNLSASVKDLNKSNWKLDLGLSMSENGQIGLSEEERANLTATVESYIANAQQFVEDQHYEFTAAVSLLLDTGEGTSGAGIIANGDAFYTGIQSELQELGSKLSESTKIALSDGILTLDEQAELTNLQTQIADITNKLATAQTAAELETIKIKFGSGELDETSFANLQAELQAQVDSATTDYDTALTTSITSLNLQLAEDAITQEQYDEQFNALVSGYKANIDNLNAQVTGVQLEILGENYSDLLGEDAKANLQNAINESVKTGISPIEWTAEETAALLGLNSMGEELNTEITSFLTQVVNSMGTAMSDADMSALSGSMSTSVSSAITNMDMAPIETAIGGVRTNTESAVASAFETPLAVTSSVDVTLDWNILNPTTTISMSGTGVETSSTTVTATNNANGGFINGKTLSWLAEEGTPEVVIPLGAHRRNRAMSLWQKTGEMLGINGYAEGGFVGANINETLSQSKGKGDIKVEVGGVTISVSVDGNSGDIVSSINAKQDEIAEIVAGALHKALEAQFSNTPLAAR